MILPDSFYKQAWNHFIIYIILLVSAIYVPIVICFFPLISKPQEFTNLFIDFCFAVDIYLNFNTAFYEKGRLNDERKQIWIRYMKTYFLIDFFTMLPYQQLYLFELNEGDNPSYEQQSYSLEDIQFYCFQVKFLRVLRFPSRFAETKSYKVFNELSFFN